jgi:hypothetical protein
MVYYMVYVFSMAGLHGNINLISSGIQYAIFIIFTVFTFFFIDYTGRRPLLIYGAIGMGVCHFVVGGVLGTYGVYTPGGVDGNLNVLITLSAGPASHVVIAFSYLLIVVYALTLAPVAWVYASEVWSLETRAYGMALASIANWLFNVIISFLIFIGPITKENSLLSVSSFHLHSTTSPGKHSLFSVCCASVPPRKRSCLIPRQRGRVWKKSKRCSETELSSHGRQKLVAANLKLGLRRWQTSREKEALSMWRIKRKCLMQRNQRRRSYECLFVTNFPSPP